MSVFFFTCFVLSIKWCFSYSLAQILWHLPWNLYFLPIVFRSRSCGNHSSERKHVVFSSLLMYLGLPPLQISLDVYSHFLACPCPVLARFTPRLCSPIYSCYFVFANRLGSMPPFAAAQGSCLAFNRPSNDVQKGERKNVLGILCTQLDSGDYIATCLTEDRQLHTLAYADVKAAYQRFEQLASRNSRRELQQRKRGFT